VLVDLGKEHPEFYIVPKWWMENDIHTAHSKYLKESAGTAPRTTPAPTTRYRCLASPSGRTAGKFSGYCRQWISPRASIHQWLVTDADLLFDLPGAHAKHAEAGMRA